MEVSKCWKNDEFPKIAIKTKIVKHFLRTKQRAALRKLFSFPSTHSPPDKILLHLWNKNFLMKIYRNVQTFAFKVLQECSSWASRNNAVQLFFLTNNRNTFAGKFKGQRFLVVLRENIIFNVKWVEACKMSEVWLIVKWVIIFASFCWLWNFLLENLKLKRNSDDVHWNVGMNIKKLNIRNNICNNKKI